MLKEKTSKFIEPKLETIEESIKLNIETSCELLSEIKNLHYLMWLSEKEFPLPTLNPEVE